MGWRVGSGLSCGFAAAERLRTLEFADALAPAHLGDAVAPLLAPYPCDHALAIEHQAEHRQPTPTRHR